MRSRRNREIFRSRYPIIRARYTAIVSVWNSPGIAALMVVALSGAPTVAAACATWCFAPMPDRAAVAEANPHLSHHASHMTSTSTVVVTRSARQHDCCETQVAVSEVVAAVRADFNTLSAPALGVVVGPFGTRTVAAAASDLSPPAAASPSAPRSLVLRI
jgi:hypothetical protein